jgi:hypothetical protein
MDDDIGTTNTGYESASVPTPPGTVVNDETPQQPVVPAQNPTPVTTPVLGKRYDNPLSKYSSYTYQLSLYMITPDAYDVFVRNGRRSIEIVNQAGVECSGGAFLVAQNGGINNQTSYRAPGFHYDFFIDNFVIDAAISPSGTSAPTTNYKCSFTVTEQYGFSFISNLKRAKDDLDAYSKTANIKELSNSSRQHFIIGIKFLGYDDAGNVINSNDPEDTFERYYDIFLTKIDFKIDGRTITYNIEAAPAPVMIAMGQKRGVIDKGASALQGATVGELLNNLCKKLNDDQLKQVPNVREFANTYKVVFVGDAVQIEKSSVVSTADISKAKWPMPTPKNKSEVNAGLQIGSQPNNNKRQFSFNRDTPIVQAIQQIINQSDYLIKGLQSVYTAAAQPNKQGNRDPIDSNQRARWFNISTIVSNARFDRKIRDFAYDITYQIRTYDTPIVLSAAADNTTPYYGPFKRYDYWLTGKNSEIIKYEQTMNNSYFTVALDPNTPDINTSSKATGGGADVPIALNKRTPAPRIGKLDLGMEAQNNYVTSLIDPGAYASVQISILGDPDFLSNDMPSGNPDLETNSQPFYGPDGFSIDPRKGQVFIEVDFKEAIDYDHEKGYMRVNDKILFWDYPPEIQKKVKGISYLVNNIRSSFRGGKFTQDLTCSIATFPDSLVGSEQSRENQQQETSVITTTYNTIVGWFKDKPVGNTSAGDPCGPIATPQPSNQETTVEGVANDEANVNSTVITGQADQVVPGGTINSLGAGA